MSDWDGLSIEYNIDYPSLDWSSSHWSKYSRPPWPAEIWCDNNEPDLRSDSNDSSLVPILRNPTFSKDDAMGLVLSAANVRGWTTGSEMEGLPVPAGGGEYESNTERISTFPWSLFTKSPRRQMRVAFTCNVCSQRTTRAINPHAYTDGTVFVQKSNTFDCFLELFD